MPSKKKDIASMYRYIGRVYPGMCVSGYKNIFNMVHIYIYIYNIRHIYVYIHTTTKYFDVEN